MKRSFTFAALAALTATAFSAQAQFTVDGTLGAGELGTGTGKYQLVSTYTGTHSAANRGLQALYMGTTATTLNVLVVASPEIDGYPALAIYLDMPNKTGIAAGTRLPGGDDKSSQLLSRPTLDMSVDYAFRVTTSPLADPKGASYYSKLDYTNSVTPNADGTYKDLYLGPTDKTGVPLVISDAMTNIVAARFAFKTTATGSLTANTTNGWEFEIPIADLGGAAAGSSITAMVAYLNNDGSFTSDVLPSIATQTTQLGTDPNFTLITGDQHVAYTVGGVLATRSSGAALKAAAYPNPVAAGSRVFYTVADQNQPVMVEAFNSLGQRAALLLPATTQGSGEHSVTLAPLSQLAAGVYLVRVQNGASVTSQRVVVN